MNGRAVVARYTVLPILGLNLSGLGNPLGKLTQTKVDGRTKNGGRLRLFEPQVFVWR